VRGTERQKGKKGKKQETGKSKKGKKSEIFADK
jgi:hypothetical protein